MQTLLRDLLTELQQRCLAVKDILSNGVFLAPANTYALTLYRQVEQLRREVDRLLQDPALGSPPLLPRQFLVYKRLAEEFQAIEAYPLPVVQRFNTEDQRMTALCAFAAPIQSATVTSTTCCYVQHQLLLDNTLIQSRFRYGARTGIAARFAEPFLQELDDYVLQEKRRALMEQRPGDTAPYDLMLVQWKDYWVIEFIADMIATYFIGEAYAWQNLRLCSRTSDTVYIPSLGYKGTHPADNARMTAITEMLDALGERAAAETARLQWLDFIAVLGDTHDAPGDYALCYPDVLMKSLAEHVQAGCEQLGLRKANAPCSSQEPMVLTELINEAWRQFLEDSAAYASWEQKQWAELHQFLQKL